MLLHFGRHLKAPPVQTDVDADADTSLVVVPPSPVLTKKTTATNNASPPRSPSSPQKISPLHVQIPDDANDGDNDDRSPTMPPSPSISVRAAELTLESSPPSSPPSPLGRLPSKQSHMRGLSVMSYRLKQLVSKEKRRFDGDGFNLDLTYVTDRLIAFGYPAENLEGMYRNHYKDVYHFFERRHAERYRIYNLCAERSYDKDKFHQRVAEFPFDDHCPPPLALFGPFCHDVWTWLGAHDQNVVAVHCKAGKGRTGVMLCAYLLYTRVWTTAYGAMEFFGAARSLKREGVTIPSQQRFIRYFAQLCQAANDVEDDEAVKELSMQPDAFHQLWEETLDGRGLLLKRSSSLRPREPVLPPTVRLVLTHIRVHGVYAHKRMDPRVRIECGVGTMAVSYEPTASFSNASGGDATVSGLSRPGTPTAASHTPTSVGKGGAFWSIVSLELPCERLLVWDEVRVALRHRSGSKMGHFWFHTAFVPRANDDDDGRYELTLLKDEIDKMYKDAKRGHKLYAADFGITLVFEVATKDDLVSVRVPRRAQSAPDVPSSSSPAATPPQTPTRQRAFASLNAAGGGLDLRHLFHTGSNSTSGGSPGRTRAVSDQSHAAMTPFASVVALVAEAETETASRISTSGKVSPTGGSVRSVPSSPKGFGARFFGLGKRDATSVSVSVSVADAAPPSHADSDDSSSSSTQS